MPGVNISKIFSGYPRPLTLNPDPGDGTLYLSPPPNKIWLILGGVINHITGTASGFAVGMKTASKPFLQRNITAATASGITHIFSTEASASTAITNILVPQWTPLFVTNEMVIAMNSGGTGAYVNLQVLEFDC